MADIELMLRARAENVAVVRHALGALGDAGALDDQTLADVRLAVTEACANVVVHAYPQRDDGPLQVDVALGEERLTVTVRDHGESDGGDRESTGLGLALIAALAETVRIDRAEPSGTAVRMTFALPRPGAPEAAT